MSNDPLSAVVAALKDRNLDYDRGPVSLVSKATGTIEYDLFVSWDKDEEIVVFVVVFICALSKFAHAVHELIEVLNLHVPIGGFVFEPIQDRVLLTLRYSVSLTSKTFESKEAHEILRRMVKTFDTNLPAIMSVINGQTVENAVKMRLLKKTKASSPPRRHK